MGKNALDNNLSNAVLIERRIAMARAARVPVDSQGVPTKPPTVFRYDDDGRFISAEPGKTDE